jgi:HAD superfamily hydrolase (TIGR01509 family)
MAPVSALSFDFNGTLSDDEGVLCAIYRSLFGERGRPLPEAAYYAELAGLSDEAIVARWLGADYPDIAGAVAERIARYRTLVADGSTVGEPVREAVRYAASRVPVVVVSGAAHAEIVPVLDAAGLAPLVTAIVSADSVASGKPDPESYLRALDLLGVAAEETVAFEDTEAGIASARSAGIRCVAVAGTVSLERLSGAEMVIEAIDVTVVRRVLDSW